MTSIYPVLPLILLAAVSALVFVAGWRMCGSPNSMAGGSVAVLTFMLHPAMSSGLQASALWDSLFVMVFVTAWLSMEHWSLFMRSWVLAGIFSTGLWLGSPFFLWGLMAMVPWVLFNRRPLAAIISLLTVFLGGLALFAVTWGGVWLVMPTIGRPLFSQWIRWSGFSLPPAVSLPWLFLTAAAVYERLKEMILERRSDASIFTAVLLLLTALLASPHSQLPLIALSAPLIARMLVKKEFLFHRRIRWVVSASFIVTLVLAYTLRRAAWMVMGLAMLLVGAGSRLLQRKSRLPRFMAGEAICVGAYLAETLATVLALFPS